MSSAEQIVGMAHKMYRCRNAAKRLLADEYQARVDVYKAALKGVMQKFKCNELEAVLKITADKEIENNEMAVIMLMSAALEISEE